MASLGTSVTIPDQVVLVGGTGRHLSERFSFVHDDQEEPDPRYNVRLSNGSRNKNTIRDRLGPRRYNGDTQSGEPYSDSYGGPPRPHVLKRLGQPYNPWHSDQSAVEQSQRGRRGGRYNSGYGNYYGSAAPNNRGASSYNYYNNGGYGGAPYSYQQNYGYPKQPRFNNYTYYNPYQHRGAYGGGAGAGGYRGRYNTYAPRQRGGGRGGRYNRNSSRSELNQVDLDRELDEYRQGGKKEGEMS